MQEKPNHTDVIFNSDCIEGMSQLPNEIVDLVITDPPFGIEFSPQKSNYNRTQNRVLDGYKEISKDNYLEFTSEWMKEIYRLLKDDGSAFIFSGWNNLKDILISIDEIGFITINHIVWKYQFGVVTKRKFVTSHYHCLFVAKDNIKRRFYPNCRFGNNDVTEFGGSARYSDMEDVWQIKREYWTGDIKTPTKLPYEIIEKILMYTSKRGDLVMDPFLGSGQVAVVSKMLDRSYLGFELVPEYFDFASLRLARGEYRVSKDRESDSKQNFLFE